MNFRFRIESPTENQSDIENKFERPEILLIQPKNFLPIVIFGINFIL